MHGPRVALRTCVLTVEKIERVGDHGEGKVGSAARPREAHGGGSGLALTGSCG